LLSVSNIAFAEFEYTIMHYICWIWIYDDALHLLNLNIRWCIIINMTCHNIIMFRVAIVIMNNNIYW